MNAMADATSTAPPITIVGNERVIRRVDGAAEFIFGVDIGDKDRDKDRDIPKSAMKEERKEEKGEVTSGPVMQAEAEEVPANVVALWGAARVGDLEVVKQLHLLDTDLNHPNGGATPLHVATAAGHTHVVAYLLSAGVEVDSPLETWYEDDEEAGYSALHIAAVHDHTEIAVMLLAAKADINKFSWFPRRLTPLHVCASSGSTSVLKLLLDGGANVSATAGPEYHQRTPLELAAALDQEDAAALLSHKGNGQLTSRL